jgi:acetylornithine deacetylase
MKGFIAVALALLPEFKTMNLAKPLHFAFSYDEEVGCHGAAVMIEDLVKNGIHPEGCIVGEPTELRPVVAHKGINLFRCRAQGKAAHSSLTHQGCNAIEYAARLICHIRDWADQIRQQGPSDPHFDVPFTSMSTNTIQGGNAHNTIPSFCEFFFEFRNLPTVDPQQILKPIKTYLHEELLPKMRREYPEASIEVDAIASVPAFEAAELASVTQLLRRLRNEKEVYKVGYATEAGLFQKASIPTILCGPGSIEQAHRANDYIAIEQLKGCEAVLRELAKSMI